MTTASMSPVVRKAGRGMCITALLVVAAFVLDVPKVSILALYAGSFVALAAWSVRPTVSFVVLLRLMLLALFTLSYYATASAHGFLEWSFAAKNGLSIVAAYWLGLAIGSTESSGSALPRAVIVTVAAAFVAFALASVVVTGPDEVELADRTISNIRGGERVNAPGIGAMAALGMGLAPAAVLGRRRNRVWHWTETVLLVALFAAGVYCNVKLANRSPFVSMALALALGAVVFLFSRDAGSLGRGASVVFAGLFASALFFAIADAPYSEKLLVAQRFSDEGLRSDRGTAWQNVLLGLPRHLGGGRLIDLGPNAYAHNLWLDVAWTSGIVPLVALVVFHCAHIPAMLRAALGRWPARDRLVAVGIGSAVLVTCIVEPVTEFSAAYFGSTFLLLGVLEGSRQASSSRASAPRRTA